MSSSPLDFFERTIRPTQESSGPTPDLAVDKLLGFSELDGERLFSELTKHYPAGHWASDGSNFHHAIEKAIQLLSAGLCRLEKKEYEAGHPLECCARIVNAPDLSPYMLKGEFNYVIVPVGFLSSLEHFISSTYSLAAIGASQTDPSGKSAAWDQDLFLGSIAILADMDIFAFTQGVMEASWESVMREIVDGFSDVITFFAFEREAHKSLMEMMPSAGGWKKFGYRDLTEPLLRYPEIGQEATNISRLSVCFAICHEFGHVFSLSVKEEGAQELALNESFTDAIGLMILYRLIESNVLPAIIGSPITPRDLGHAVAAFHSWNLSKELGRLLKQKEELVLADTFTRIHEVAGRWQRAMMLIQKAWTEQIPALAHTEEKVSIGYAIMNHWGVMTAGMLRVVLLKYGHNCDIAEACTFLPLLANRDSKLYTLLV